VDCSGPLNDSADGGLAAYSHRDSRGIIGRVSTPSGWLVVQRDLTGSVQVKDAPEIWFTAVFSADFRDQRIRPHYASSKVSCRLSHQGT
jgi:hypothetical protein